MYGPNLCAKYQEQSGDDVKIVLFTSGCPFDDQPDSLYKMWAIPLTLRTKPLPPITLINDDDPALHYAGNWQSAIDYPFIEHNDRDNCIFSHTRGDAVEYTFNGTGIALLADKDRDMGSMDVFLDDQQRGQVNLKVENFPPPFPNRGLQRAKIAPRQALDSDREYEFFRLCHL